MTKEELRVFGSQFSKLALQWSKERPDEIEFSQFVRWFIEKGEKADIYDLAGETKGTINGH